jgi:hypothetical protein
MRPHDYLVIGEDGEPVEVAARASGRLKRLATERTAVKGA